MVKDIVKGLPTEFAFPESTIKAMASFDASYNTLQSRMNDLDNTIELLQQKKVTFRAQQAHDSASKVHVVREFLATEGVRLDDLGNWVIEADKAVRKVPPNMKE